MHIIKNGSQASAAGSIEYFTGTVRLDQPFQQVGAANLRGAFVTFEPGARTAWHTHPLGQTLIVTAGLGWVQLQGRPIQEIHPGDVVIIEANERHWHGATPNTAVTHIALQEALEGKVVEWMEQVSDDDYKK